MPKLHNSQDRLRWPGAEVSASSLGFTSDFRPRLTFHNTQLSGYQAEQHEAEQRHRRERSWLGDSVH